MRGQEKQSCFVIMPFGEKKDSEGREIDFDEIYDSIIRPTVEKDLDLRCVRSDGIHLAGSIHQWMFENILSRSLQHQLPFPFHEKRG